MSDPNPWGVAFKVTLYLFDLGSDWVNGILMLMPKNGTGTKIQFDNSTSDSCGHEDSEVHPAWGSLSITLSWVPALIGLVIIVLTKRSIWDLLLAPIRFILWPLIVPILMVAEGICGGGGAWLLGVDPSIESFKFALVFKYLEGIFEATPQLILQLYITTRIGICLKYWQDWIKIVSMVSSTWTIHMASTDIFFFFAEEGKKVSMKESIVRYFKLAPFFVPAIAFKAGTVAAVFAAFKYYGLVVLAIWALVYCGTALVIGRVCGDFESDQLLLMFPNMLTIFGDKTHIRLSVWLCFVLNTGTLILIYLLQSHYESTIYLSEEKVPAWVTTDLHITGIPLVIMGLLSGISAEVYLNCFPELVKFGDD